MLTLQEVKDLAQEIYEDLEDYEFCNEGPIDEDGDIIGGDFTTFQLLRIPSIAAGNCLNVSQIVEEKISGDFGVEEVFGTEGNHAFLIFPNNYVVDFTYRQFDQNSDFPLVRERSEYMEDLMEYLNGELEMDA